MKPLIDCDDTKAMEMALEVLLRGYLNTIRLTDIEDALEMEFEDFMMAQENLHWVIAEYRKKKGL